MPSDAPDVHMNWANLLFLHWRVDPAVMRPLVPEPLELDLFDGSAWIALVPFRMEKTSFRGIPKLPGLANFFECNVRTYARYRGKSGVWFFSLDAQTLLPVLGGRRLWSLNYVYSKFNVSRTETEGAGEANVTDYRLTRRRGPWRPGHTHVTWRTGDPLPPSQPGSLEHFLTERYWLFTRRGRIGERNGRHAGPRDAGRIMAGEVRHAPWPLRAAELLHLDDTLIAAAGVKVSGLPILHASRHLVVNGYSLCEP